MKRFLSVALATVLAGSLLAGCSKTETTTTNEATTVEATTEEATTEEEVVELDYDGLVEEVDKVQELYATGAEAAKANGDEEEYAALGEEIATLLEEIGAKGDAITQDEINEYQMQLVGINDAIADYTGAVADSATESLQNLQANAEAVEGYYTELVAFVDEAYKAGTLTEDTNTQCQEYGAKLEELNAAISEDLQKEDTTIEDVDAMAATLEEVYGELEDMATNVGAEIAAVQLVGAAADEEAAVTDEEAAPAAEGEEEAATEAAQ